MNSLLPCTILGTSEYPFAIGLEVDPPLIPLPPRYILDLHFVLFQVHGVINTRRHMILNVVRIICWVNAGRFWCVANVITKPVNIALSPLLLGVVPLRCMSWTWPILIHLHIVYPVSFRSPLHRSSFLIILCPFVIALMMVLLFFEAFASDVIPEACKESQE